MSPTVFCWILGVALAAMLVVALVRGLRLPLPYRNRRCTGPAWREAFPRASKDTIRTFLDCLTEGMGFRKQDRLRFAPDDQVVHIYRSLYDGRTPLADALEMETFAEELARQFAIPLEDLLAVWTEEVTLGTLFARVTSPVGTTERHGPGGVPRRGTSC